MCYEEKKKSQTWKKSSITDLCSKFSNSLTFNDNKRKRWKKDESLTAINKSTFSVHIAAYENSSVAATFDSSNKSLKKSWFIKQQKQIIPVSTFICQNPFDFPRQQNDQTSDPEVSQFRSYQQLLNYHAASNDDHRNAIHRRTVNRKGDVGDCEA
uniref:Uncharacterized protein n=1 Tax=Panagrolaimus davidi TaxID=227884 RepID=A0A914QD69_9BILA